MTALFERCQDLLPPTARGLWALSALASRLREEGVAPGDREGDALLGRAAVGAESSLRQLARQLEPELSPTEATDVARAVAARVAVHALQWQGQEPFGAHLRSVVAADARRRASTMAARREDGGPSRPREALRRASWAWLRDRPGDEALRDHLVITAWLEERQLGELARTLPLGTASEGEGTALLRWRSQGWAAWGRLMDALAGPEGRRVYAAVEPEVRRGR